VLFVGSISDANSLSSDFGNSRAEDALYASKTIVGLPSTSIVNIESENRSFISPSPSTPVLQDFRAANST
jgi:hypothetical protein